LSEPLVYLARHGRTAYNHERRFQGRLPVPLDEEGRAQAAALAELAAAHDFRALWSSPLRRARETAEIVAARVGLEVREDERLVETDAGAWTNRLFSDVHAEAPAEFERFVALDPAFAFPGGESFADQSLRVRAALEDIGAEQTPALVVCHGVVIRLALASLLESAEDPTDLPVRVANGALVPLSAEVLAEAAATGGTIGLDGTAAGARAPEQEEPTPGS
jgi:broad specificity phosphatase PhoE